MQEKYSLHYWFIFTVPLNAENEDEYEKYCECNEWDLEILDELFFEELTDDDEAEWIEHFFPLFYLCYV